jgi:hypothetical protein
MQSWLKFYEAITKPLPVASSLFLIISTSFLLTASDAMLAGLGMSRIAADYRWVVGMGFLIAATWLIVTAIISLGKWFHQEFSVHRAAEKQRRRLRALTADERKMLRRYVETETREMNFYAMELGVAQGLANDGILYRPDVPFQLNSVPYNIQESVLAYLTKNQALVADVVPSESRWKSK